MQPCLFSGIEMQLFLFSGRQYGELERVPGELNHSRALLHLHKQVQKLMIYPKYTNMPNIHLCKKEQDWQSCLVLHCLRQPRQILAKWIFYLSRTKIRQNWCKFVLFSVLTYIFAEKFSLHSFLKEISWPMQK